MDHFAYKDSILHAEDVALPLIAASAGTPFYCYSTATLTRHYRVFNEAFAQMNPLICYAVKACETLAVLRTLAREGSGADVVSGGEIRAALAAGIPAQKMVFSGVGKTQEEMEFALEQNIFQFNVESEGELELLSHVAGRMKKTAHIALRVNPDIISGTHSKIATGHKGSKFGVPIDEALSLYNRAATLENIQVQGVSVHIGSQLSMLTPFKDAFTRVVTLARALRANGHDISTLDLGGGLGVPYGDQASPPLPTAYANIVKEVTHGLECRLIFEPGRLLVANAGILVTKVLYIKRSGERLIVVVDAGMNDLLRPAMYDAYHDIVPVVTSEAGTELVDVVGPVCESSDVFAKARLLKVPKVADLLAFRTAGAYGSSMASTYNARPLLAEIMVNGSEWEVVRRRQTYEELLARDSVPQWLR